MSYRVALQPRTRRWTVKEFRSRLHELPEKLELLDGELELTDRELAALLGLALELNGAARAIRMGDPEVWRRAVAAL